MTRYAVGYSSASVHSGRFEIIEAQDEAELRKLTRERLGLRTTRGLYFPTVEHLGILLRRFIELAERDVETAIPESRDYFVSRLRIYQDALDKLQD